MSVKVLRAIGAGVTRTIEAGMVRRAARDGASRYAVGHASRLSPGRFLAPTSFAPTARIALNRGQRGVVVKHLGRAGDRVKGGAPAPSRQSVAATYLADCNAPTLRIIATRRISEHEGFVDSMVRLARSRGMTALAEHLEVATSNQLDVDTKGLLDALETMATRLNKKDLAMASQLTTLRAELFDLAQRASGVRHILRRRARDLF